MKRMALITGASSGIGAAFAEVFAAEGFALVITARREDRLTAVSERLRQRYGRHVEVIPADLSEHDAPARLCDEFARRGLSIDVLVNNGEFHDVTGTRAVVRELPPWLWMDAAHVAREGFDAVMAGTPIYVTGRVNRTIATLARHLPERVLVDLGRRVARRYRKS